jgi:rRNA maturation protein Nop10
MTKPLSRAVKWIQKGDSLSPDRMQVLDVNCRCCGNRTRIPAPTIIDAAERYWRERYERLMGSLNEVVARCHVKHGTDPMRQDFQKWLIALREKLGMEDGEEWKKGDH